MLIAQAKKKENIAEYVLYMWQIEDLLRAMKFDMKMVDQYIVKAFNANPDTKVKILDWYENFAESMKVEGIEEKGHLQITKAIVDELSKFHLALLNDPLHHDYLHRFFEVQQFIIELRNKSTDSSLTDIEVCFNGLYIYMMMKVKKQTITPETEQAFARIAKVIALLVKRHQEAEKEYSNDIF